MNERGKERGKDQGSPRAHERFHELLALRLYDELEPAEARALDDHLAACTACRAFAATLGEGLGRLVPVGVPEHDLPAGWEEGLRRRLRVAGEGGAGTAPARGRRTALVAFAAGLAAGLLVALVVPGSPAPGRGPAGGGAAPASGPARFARATPPPPASSRGPLARLGPLLREERR